MIRYNPGYWAVSYFFQIRLWRGSIIPKTFGWAIICTFLTWMLCEYLGPSIEGSWRKAASKDFAVAWGSYTFIMGTMIVFRINQAYSRYWECASAIHQCRTKWFNAVSNAFAFCSAEESLRMQVLKYQHEMVRLVSMLFCAALSHLEEKKLGLEILEVEGMNEESLEFLNEATDQPEVIMQWIQRLTVTACAKGIIPIPPPLATRVFQELGQGMFEYSQARKVRDIPIPYPYVHMVTMFIFFHLGMTIVATALTIERNWLSMLATFVSVVANVGAYYIAHEIEAPFGSNMNDLPLAEAAQDMNRALTTILEPLAQEAPEYHFKGARQTYSVCFTNDFTQSGRLPSCVGLDSMESDSSTLPFPAGQPSPDSAPTISVELPTVENRATMHPVQSGRAALPTPKSAPYRFATTRRDQLGRMRTISRMDDYDFIDDDVSRATSGKSIATSRVKTNYSVSAEDSLEAEVGGLSSSASNGVEPGGTLKVPLNQPSARSVQFRQPSSSSSSSASVSPEVTEKNPQRRT